MLWMNNLKKISMNLRKSSENWSNQMQSLATRKAVKQVLSSSCMIIRRERKREMQLRTCGCCSAMAVLFEVVVVFLSVLVASGRGDPGVGITFILGDSLVEAGNNNYLLSLARADLRPNGIDFVRSGGSPTGRFTNGRTITDLVGEGLGNFIYAVPVLAPNSSFLILNGINYASGGGGILNETGANFIERISMDSQIDYFNTTRQQLYGLLGPAARDFIAKSLFSVTMGSNDFINNYLLPVSTRIYQSPNAFINQLITNFRSQLIKLYNLDVRKLVVANVGPLGCIPNQRSMNQAEGSINQLDQNQCVAMPNQLVAQFNSQLRDLVEELNKNLPGATFLLANVHDIFLEIINNYQRYGFTIADTACCGSGGTNRGLIPCGISIDYCPDRSKYIYWDTFHPSEAVNLIIARKLLDGNTNSISPINIRQLNAL